MNDIESGYRSNPLLKRIGVSIEYTEYEIEEYIKCTNDPIYFIENYMTVVHVDKGVVPFKLYDFQKEMIQAMHENRHTCILASRQCGKSITTIGYILWLSLFRSDQVIAILANKGQLARDLLDRYQLAYEAVPHFLQQGISIWQKGKVELENNSKVFASSTSANSLRGSSVNFLYCDEFAFVHNNMASAFFNSIYPVISSGETTKLVISSCVTKDTYVFTNNGIGQIQDYINYNIPDNPNVSYNIPRYQIYGMDGVRSGEYFCNNGKIPTKIIRSSSAILECSLEHKLWVYKNGTYDWVKAKDLTENDYVSIKYGENIWGNNDDISDYVPFESNKSYKKFIPPKTITKDLAYFLGLYLAEGYSRKKNGCFQTTITCGDDISETVNSLGLSYVKYDDVHYTINSAALIHFLEYFGFDISKKAKEKVIPKRLFSCSKEVICSFLSGFFDGDGCATPKGRISVASASKQLIIQLRILLLNVGILTQYYSSITPPTKRVKVESLCHKLELNDYNSCMKFYDEIGFKLNRKQERKNILVPPKKRISKDIIPDARLFFEKNGLNIIENPTFKRTNHVTRERSLEVEGIENFPEIFHPNLKWEKVKQITDSENEVYDFSLDHIENDKWCHSVLYNGIVGHQTPNGMNLFYKIWTDAVAGKNGYKPVRVRWNQVPGRDEKYKEEYIMKTDQRQWSQEMESVGFDTELTIDEKNIKIGDLYKQLSNGQ